MGLRVDASCECYHMDDADFVHLAWFCAPIAAYWVEGLGVLSDMVGVMIAPNVRLAFLGCIFEFKSTQRRFLALALLLAKIRVSIHWGRGPIPTKRAWLKDLVYCSDALDAYWEYMPEASCPKDILCPLRDYLGLGQTLLSLSLLLLLL